MSNFLLLLSLIIYIISENMILLSYVVLLVTVAYTNLQVGKVITIIVIHFHVFPFYYVSDN